MDAIAFARSSLQHSAREGYVCIESDKTKHDTYYYPVCVC